MKDPYARLRVLHKLEEQATSEIRKDHPESKIRAIDPFDAERRTAEPLISASAIELTITVLLLVIYDLVGKVENPAEHLNKEAISKASESWAQCSKYWAGAMSEKNLAYTTAISNTIMIVGSAVYQSLEERKKAQKRLEPAK